MSVSTAPRVGTPSVDPRGLQLTAAVTTVVLAVVLVIPASAATLLVGAQAVLFAAGALGGVQRTPSAWLFRRVVRPRLSPPTELEDPRPPQFAQGVGLAFTAVAFLGFLAGATVVGQVATGLALAAALLNAVFRLCLGCELYLLLQRLRPAATAG